MSGVIVELTPRMVTTVLPYTPPPQYLPKLDAPDCRCIGKEIRFCYQTQPGDLYMCTPYGWVPNLDRK